MATEYCTLEVWVLVDESGEYEVGTSSEDCGSRFEDNVGFDNEVGTRRVKLTVKVPLPKPIELSGEVVCDEGGSELKVA